MPSAPARRMSRLGTETAFEVLARARALEAQGRSIIHLEIGEPDFDTPGHVVEAGCAALRAGHTHYGPAAGIPELRTAVAEEMRRTRGLRVSPEQVLVCPGAKPIMFYMLLALVDDEDEVLYPNPGFPIYESMIAFCGGRPVPIPLLESEGFAFGIEQLRRLVTDRTRVLILNSPSNPTGGILEPPLLEAIASLAVERDLWVLSDEIYGRILYEGTHTSIATFPGMAERTMILDGFSKIYSMTGWRLGYGVGPKALIQSMTKLQVNSASCTATFTQHAGVAALEGPQGEAEEMVRTFRERRDVMVDGLNRIPGVSCVRPKGAFYAFPSIAGTGLGSQAVADRLLAEAGVAVLPGTAFGAHGEGHIRLSYANSMTNIEEALRRIDRCLRTGS
jgi:aspartate aminotransferase